MGALANIATAVTRYCPSNQLTGIDNTTGDEFVHFDESLHDFRGRIGHRLNRASAPNRRHDGDA
jgi:hypothetical protein